MRTKALLGLAALAVGLSTSVAQNVYSVNVVGYVNVTLHANKLHFLALPLMPVDGNFDISNTIRPDNSQDFAGLLTWTGTGWDTTPEWLGDDINDPLPGSWSVTKNITNGTAFFFASQAESTLTFVGQVPQGNAINYAWGSGLNPVANVLPLSTNFPGNTVGNSFDAILLWDLAASSWNTDWTYIGSDITAPDPPYWDNGGATDIGGPDNVNGPLINPGQGFFYMNAAGIPVTFTQNFTVQ
jgi:hypothetical protein